MHVLAPHQRGYTPEALPPGRAAYALDGLVDDALDVPDRQDVPAAHLVGHDLGGLVAWALAARDPDRVRPSVLSTPHPRPWVALLHSNQALRSAYVGMLQVPALPEQVALAGDARRAAGAARRHRRPAQVATPAIDGSPDQPAVGA